MPWQRDTFSEALNEKSSTIKIKFEGGCKQQLPVWICGTPGEFLIHVGRVKNVMGKGWSRD